MVQRYKTWPGKVAVAALSLWLSVYSLAVPMAMAQDISVTAGSGQGEGQGVEQGDGQGGLSAADLGADTDGNLPEGVEDTRQGADQGSTNGIVVENSETGAGSLNTNDVATDASTSTQIDNTSNTDTTAGVTANSGENDASRNTGTGAIGTGSAGIGVTQVTNDNTAVIGGGSGLTVDNYAGDQTGDITIGFGAGTAQLTDQNGSGSSVKVTNEVTGSDSTNIGGVTTNVEDVAEVQNDGQINTALDLGAISGQNTAWQNTGDGIITTGDADAAATLVNLLNTTVLNGDLWVTVANIFGDLTGNINIANLETFLSQAAAQAQLVDASNEQTGAGSDNSIDVDLASRDATDVQNSALVNTEVNAEAITGQNTANDNTGGAEVQTGDASVSASNLTLANTTVEGGDWGLFIVNALNGWLGFLVGAGGEVRALSQDETLERIEAQNQQTGADSENTAEVNQNTETAATVDNDAVINNLINASAITGQNDASENTGAGRITTGDANVEATAVNIANTTVKNGSLFVAVVNIFGDWFGDLLYGGKSLATTAAEQQAAIVVDASNNQTGADSSNEIGVDIEDYDETNITNDADVTTVLNATIDTGTNRTNRNTGGAAVETGTGALAVNVGNVINTTLLGGEGGTLVEVAGANERTGAESNNTVEVNVNDREVINITNNADVTTILGRIGAPLQVNTGNNEANKNTLGVTIKTGDAVADVAIHNWINKTILALADRGLQVSADFVNLLTGALSENLNRLIVDRETLLTLMNDANVYNLLNLLLNTGGNTANANTGGVAIETGAVCVEAEIDNSVNDYQVTGWAGVQAKIANWAGIDNEARIDAATGDNEANRNTGALTEAGQRKCPEKARPEASPSPSPSPTPGAPAPVEEDKGVGGPPGAEEEQPGEEKAGEEARGEAGEEKREGRVAAAQDKPPKAEKIPKAPGEILAQFPVTGMRSLARMWQGRSELAWQYYLAAAAVMALGGAVYRDRKLRIRAGAAK